MVSPLQQSTHHPSDQVHDKINLLERYAARKASAAGSWVKGAVADVNLLQIAEQAVDIIAAALTEETFLEEQIRAGENNVVARLRAALVIIIPHDLHPVERRWEQLQEAALAFDAVLLEKWSHSRDDAQGLCFSD
mmetsp:Transcript_76567/g.139308  ORF Transcript_76567/g.139308 Transcript_76567/m.139308 type:complete len:135 (-) Transcript_76567:111-515(-)